MAELDFMGKRAVYVHHLTVPIRPLVLDKAKSLNPEDSGNLIIHGDNLHALKALLPRYAGCIDCIYIDPPYNTGNEHWVYNDNVSSPMMQGWLENAREVDGEDPVRHDKWLCMMWPRLQLLKELLTEDGVIFVSIDDNEQHRLRMVMDETFGDFNFIAQLVWKKKYTGGKHSGHFVDLHEYVLVYGNKQKIGRFMVERPEGERGKFTKKDKNFPKLGRYYDRPFKSNLDARKTLVYPITLPNGKTVKNQWIAGQEKYEAWKKEGKAFFKKLQTGEYAVYVKYYEREGQGLVMFPSIIDETSDVQLAGLKKQHGAVIRRILTEMRGKATDSQVSLFLRTMFVNPSVVEGVYNNDATTELGEIFGIKGTRDIKSIFSTSKPSDFIKRLIKTATRKNALVLDSFAGSGTTAQAVLALNREDGGTRNFILVECERYANTTTAERVRRVINGVPTAKSKHLREPMRGSFAYCTLGKPLDINKMLRGEELPDYSTLASHLLYTATGISVTVKLKRKNKDGLFYSVNGTDYYLLYMRNLGYLRSDEPVLTSDRAERISKIGNRAVVFGPGSYLKQRDLTRMGIEFCFVTDGIRQA